MLTLARFSSLLLLCGAAACGSDAGVAPSAPVSSEFTGTIDGLPWATGEASAVAYVTDADTMLMLTGLKGTPGAHSEQLTVVLHGLGPQGSYTLKDFSSHAYGVFIVSEGSSDPESTQTFGTTNATGGSLIISHLDRAAQTVAGSYSFEGDDDRGSLPPHYLAGKFQANFIVQRVP